jgi:hypothetical protein
MRTVMNESLVLARLRHALSRPEKCDELVISSNQLSPNPGEQDCVPLNMEPTNASIAGSASSTVRRTCCNQNRGANPSVGTNCPRRTR